MDEGAAALVPSSEIKKQVRNGVDALQVVAYVIFAAVAACTLFNTYAAVTARSVGRVTRLDVRLAVWCALAALAGVALLLLTLTG